MNEEAWVTSRDPQAMLAHVKARASDRKLRLFAVACCRQLVWPQLRDGRCREAVAVAERFADGLANVAELERAAEVTQEAVAEEAFGSRAYHAAFAANSVTRTDWSAEVMARQALFGAYASGEPKQVGTERRSSVVRQRQKATHKEVQQRKAMAAALLRDVFGNPFRPSADIDPSWLTWNGGTVAQLARSIYEQRRFEDMGVLADVLKEAGCQVQEILGHLRQEEGHCRGCWVLDLLTGRG